MAEINGKSSNLPKGWVKAKLSQLCLNPKNDIVDGPFGSNLKVSDYQDSGIPILRIQNIERNQFIEKDIKFLTPDKATLLKRHSYQVGDIVVTKLGQPLGKACIVPNTFKSGIIVADVVKIRPADSHILRKFLVSAINSVFVANQLKQKTKGTTRPRVNLNHIRNVEILLPPLLEQHRIVEKIEELFSELDNGVESLKKALKQLKTYRQAVLKWAFEGKLTEAWRTENQDTIEDAETLLTQIKTERKRHYQQQLEEWQKAIKDWEANGKDGKKPSKPQQPKELPPLTQKELSALPSLPDGWCWIYLGQLLNSIEAGKSFKCEERPPRVNEVGVAKVSAVTWGEYNELESKTCLDTTKIYKKFLINKNDFLFSRANTIELVGACVIARDINLKVMLSDKTLRLHFIYLSNKKFILYFLRSRYGRNEIERLATGNQESMRNIGQDRIKKIITPFPSLQEQSQIVQEIESRLSICDQLEATITDNLEKAEALRQSILKRAFEGKLVPQNPDDEPASELLKRLRL